MPGIYWLLGPLVALAMVAPVRAADAWAAADVHGSVLALIAGQWLEIKRGDAVGSGVAVRTLQAGSLVLKRGGETLRLGHDTTIRPSVAGGAVTIEQYSGVLSMLEPGRGGTRLVTPGFVAAPAAASLVSRVAAGTASLRVSSGAVEIARGGYQVLVTAGQTYSPQGAAAAADAGSSGNIRPDDEADSGAAGAGESDAAAAGAGAEAAPAESGHQDNGVGNGGTPGNGGQNGNAGGNGNSGQHRQSR